MRLGWERTKVSERVEARGLVVMGDHCDPESLDVMALGPG